MVEGLSLKSSKLERIYEILADIERGKGKKGQIIKLSANQQQFHREDGGRSFLNFKFIKVEKRLLTGSNCRDIDAIVRATGV
jgi:hypothetical protein